MSALEGLNQWLLQNGDGELQSEIHLGGGCINQASAIQTQCGKVYFLKQNALAPVGIFASEARSLALLAASKTLRVPKVHYQDDTCLLLEYLPPGRRQPDYWEQFGSSLAYMHRNLSPTFGLEFQTFCGTTPQPNPPMSNGYEFFREHRLLMQGRLALDSGLCNQNDIATLERLGNRLPGLIPEQPASLLHGDLWSGNAHTGPEGEPVLIDPALYYGWREAELGMTALFGGFPETFYAAYQQVWPLEPGWRRRLEIYNLYHLLNHLNLFGGRYLGQVRAVLKRY